jgi:hypothetical protein
LRVDYNWYGEQQKCEGKFDYAHRLSAFLILCGTSGPRTFFSRKGAKAQSAAALLKDFFAPLRLCARHLV